METDLHASLPRHLKLLLEDLEVNQSRLRAEMNAGMAASAGAGANPKHIAYAESLTKSSIALSRELRAWAKQTREASQNLSVAQRIALVVAFVKSLSAADRATLEAALRE